MKIQIQNLGVIDHANLEVEKLTIICGGNNTGKTYANYALYGFLRSWRKILYRVLSQEIRSLLDPKKENQIDLEKIFKGKINQFLERISNRYISYLPEVYASKSNFFSNTKFIVSIENEVEIINSEYHKALRDSSGERIIATITKLKGTSLLELTLSEPESVRLFHRTNDFIIDAIIEIVFSPLFPDVFIASAERTGAAIFRKELDFARTRLIEALSSKRKIDNDDPLYYIRTIESGGYAMPIRDNVDFVRQLEDIDKETGELISQYPNLYQDFEDILGGSYKVIKGKGLNYIPKTNKKPRLTMTESSSSVRALLDIGYYLHSKAKQGDLLMIDEPELNLHPTNQRKLARLLVRIINKGVRIFITTHSDYFVKEFNTLIMFYNKNDQTKDIQKRYEYQPDELLNPMDVRLYMSNAVEPQNKRKKKMINTFYAATIHKDQGIEVDTFDTTIDEMNKIQSEILETDLS